MRNGRFYALENISFTLEEGGCTVIAGANGSGKSLLMSIIAGLETPASGIVKTTGRVLRAKTLRSALEIWGFQKLK